MIPCANPHAQYSSHKAEIDESIGRVLNGGRYILGDEVSALEREFAAYLGAQHGVGVGSGTEALHVALCALGIGAGDEVITVSHTAVATVAAIELCGAVPVLVEIEPEYFTMAPDRLESAITARSRAIIPVHLYGQPCDMVSILDIARRHSIPIVEDCAQAHGAALNGRRVGVWGNLGCFSFYPTKNLGAMGDGGMVVTNDSDLADRVRKIREYGWSDRYVSQSRGWNTRLDEVQAAILRVKLRYLDQDNDARSKLAEKYEMGLAGSGLGLPLRRHGATHVRHLYVVRSRQRQALRSFLNARGIGTLVHYPVPVHLQPAFLDRLPGADSMPITEKVAAEVLSLPMYPELSQSDVSSVIEAVQEFRKESHD